MTLGSDRAARWVPGADEIFLALDIVAERLRRWTANPLGSPRVGSNPIDVASDITRKEPMPIQHLFNMLYGKFLPTRQLALSDRRFSRHSPLSLYPKSLSLMRAQNPTSPNPGLLFRGDPKPDFIMHESPLFPPFATPALHHLAL